MRSNGRLVWASCGELLQTTTIVPTCGLRLMRQSRIDPSRISQVLAVTMAMCASLNCLPLLDGTTSGSPRQGLANATTRATEKNKGLRVLNSQAGSVTNATAAGTAARRATKGVRAAHNAMTASANSENAITPPLVSKYGASPCSCAMRSMSQPLVVCDLEDLATGSDEPMLPNLAK